MKLSEASLKSFYLEWVNDWITVDAMASYYGLSIRECSKRIAKGRELHHNQFDDYNV